MELDGRPAFVALFRLSHIKRADFLVMMLVRLSLAAFWFNPELTVLADPEGTGKGLRRPRPAGRRQASTTPPTCFVQARRIR
jgi:hypothetical protein